MGLLSKASLLGQSKKLAFFDLITKYNIKCFSIFELINDSYVITNSLGFDGTSILNSISTPDFWDGICKEKETIYSFKNNSSNPLLQFFSFKIKDEVNDISVFKLDNSIVLICNSQIDENFIKDYKLINSNETKPDINSLNSLITKDSLLYKLSINFEEATETFILTKSKSKEFNSIFTKSITKELINRVLFYYNDFNASIIINENQIKSVFICDCYTSKNILINHLVLNFKEVLDNSAEIINFDFDGKAEAFSDIQDFLKVE